MNNEYEYEYDPMDDIKEFPRHTGRLPEGVLPDDGWTRGIAQLKPQARPIHSVINQFFDFTPHKKTAQSDTLRYGSINCQHVNNVMIWGIETIKNFKQHTAREDKELAYAMAEGIRDIASQLNVYQQKRLYWTAIDAKGLAHPGWWAITQEGIAFKDDHYTADPLQRYFAVYADGDLLQASFSNQIHFNKVIIKGNKNGTKSLTSRRSSRVL